MSGQDINYPKLEDLDICGTLPLIERDGIEKINFHYKITPRKFGLEYVEVYVNAKKNILIKPQNSLSQTEFIT